MKTVDVAVWGSSGYAGQELVGILEGHPNIGQIAEVGRGESEDFTGIEAAFLAIPHGKSSGTAKQLVKTGSTVIDLSGDFRFKTTEEYESWYHKEHLSPELLPAPYGLPELCRQEMLGSKLIANPGCYPTAVLLGVMPLVRENLISDDAPIIVDALSGVSGMGKANREEADRIIATGDSYSYKVGRIHQHVGEIEQFLGGRHVFFSPSVGPFFRGMLVRSTVELKNSLTVEHAEAVLHEAYDQEPFVRILTGGEMPTIEDTKHTNICAIGLLAVGRTLQVISSIDNLRKGAASQAVQGFNIAFGYAETTGLTV